MTHSRSVQIERRKRRWFLRARTSTSVLADKSLFSQLGGAVVRVRLRFKNNPKRDYRSLKVSVIIIITTYIYKAPFLIRANSTLPLLTTITTDTKDTSVRLIESIRYNLLITPPVTEPIWPSGKAFG